MAKFCEICGNPTHRGMKLCGRHYRLDNIDRIKAYLSTPDAKEKKRICDKRWRDNNKEKKRMMDKRYAMNNKEKLKKYRQKYWEENSSKLRESSRIYRINNKEKISENKKKYYMNNMDKIKKYKDKWYAKNKEYKSARDKIYRLNHKDKILKKKEEYRNKNRDLINAKRRTELFKKKQRIHMKKKRIDRPDFKLKENLRLRLRKALNYYTKTGKIIKSKQYGIDYNKIIEYLKPFPEDLSLYHIDHIRPLCSFNLEDPQEVKKAFAPENHQWLLAFDNQSKGGKYGI